MCWMNSSAGSTIMMAGPWLPWLALLTDAPGARCNDEVAQVSRVLSAPKYLACTLSPQNATVECATSPALLLGPPRITQWTAGPHATVVTPGVCILHRHSPTQAHASCVQPASNGKQSLMGNAPDPDLTNLSAGPPTDGAACTARNSVTGSAWADSLQQTSHPAAVAPVAQSASVPAHGRVLQ